MSGRFQRQARITDNFSQVPHGLWTADLTWGAKCLLGWLHSHEERYLSSLSNNRIRQELGASGSVAGWVTELVEAGFITVEKSGQRNKFTLMAAPWESLAARKCEPAEKRSVDEPADYRPVTDRLPAGNQPKNGHIEEQVEHQLENHSFSLFPSDQENQSSTGESSPAKSKKRNSMEGFSDWWSEYPRKTSRAKAETRWKNMTQQQRTAALEALPKHIAHWEITKTAPQFIPMPATWLNQCRWEDELTTSLAKPKNYEPWEV
jgi:hypothetical protein